MTTHRFRAAFASILVLSLLAVTPLSALAAAGDLDPTFGNAGTVTTAILGVSDTADGMALQSDGKIVAAGACQTSTGPQSFCLARYNSDGSLDTSFGGGGTVTTAIGSAAYANANTVTVQTNGKIVAAGFCWITTTYGFCLARYNSDGSLDASFGAGGTVTTAIGPENIAYGVAVQSDGKIVAAGYCQANGGYNLHFCLARYKSDGNLDASFGIGGTVTTATIATPNPGFQASDVARGLVVQTDGKIVAAGTCLNQFCLARYNSDGSLDMTFGTAGTVLTTTGSYNDGATSVALQSDGKLVVAGSCFVSAYPTRIFCLARYNSNGSLDTSFGAGASGYVTTGFSSALGALVNAVAVQTDGRIVAAGACNIGPFTLFCLARYNSDGSLDASFGTGGEVRTAVDASSDYATGVVVQSDGKIVAAGQCALTSAHPVFCLARYDGGAPAITHLKVNAVASSKTYGAADPTLGYTLSGFVNGDTSANVTGTATCTRVAGETVAGGPYTITCGPGSLAAPGYDVATGSTASFTITPAPLKVTAPAISKLLNGANPTFTPTYSGFVNGDSAPSLTIGPTCSTTAMTGSPVGSYPVTCSGGVSANYSFTYVPGTLSIIYGFGGFLQPINDTAHTLVCGSPCPASIFKGGSTVPVKFQLMDANGLVVQASSAPFWITPQKGGATSASIDETVYSDPATTGTTYTSDGSHYGYNWSTKGFATGYFWRIGVQFDDGQTYYVSIGLR